MSCYPCVSRRHAVCCACRGCNACGAGSAVLLLAAALYMLLYPRCSSNYSQLTLKVCSLPALGSHALSQRASLPVYHVRVGHAVVGVCSSRVLLWAGR